MAANVPAPFPQPTTEGFLPRFPMAYNNLSNMSLCLIAAMFIGGGLLTSLKCHECHPISAFKRSLTVGQTQIYEKIVQERKALYLKGLFFGLVLATVLLFFTGNSLNPITSGCVYAGVILTVQYFYYTLSKKSPLMVNYLNSQEQIALWNQVYTKMQRKYHMGLVMGLVGYALLPTVISRAQAILI